MKRGVDKIKYSRIAKVTPPCFYFRQQQLNNINIYLLVIFPLLYLLLSVHFLQITMEETMINPTQNYSADGNQMHVETACLNRKRKFPAEQLHLSLRKHKSPLNSYLESVSIRNINHKELNLSPSEFKSCRRVFNDISQSGSAKDSNSFFGGKDTTMSISSQIRDDIWYFKASVFNELSTSSVNWASTCSTKSSYNIGEERDIDHNNSESHSSPCHDGGHASEFISLVDYTCLDFGHENMKQCTDYKDQDAIHSNGVIPHNNVHSSGRWLVNQGSEQCAKKLTIDKEFEQYFSLLMM